MFEFLLIGAVWLLLSLPVSVLVGKCIGVGQAGETERHAASAVDASAAAPVSSGAALPALPTQRRPATSRQPVR